MSITKVLAGVGIVITFAAVAGVYGGAYNIGADAPHWTATHSMIDIFRERSIAARSARIVVPPLDDPAMIAEGAEHYSAMCVQCHLAPGIENTELREGLYPLPPNLAEHNHDESDHGNDAARQFWIIKHGIKMTGMPAAGKTHDDDELWGIVAFVRKLPDMTPEQYAELTADTEHHEHGDTKGGAPESPAQNAQPEHHHEDTEAVLEHDHAPQPSTPQ